MPAYGRPYIMRPATRIKMRELPVVECPRIV
jgi:hypothetical protein